MIFSLKVRSSEPLSYEEIYQRFLRFRREKTVDFIYLVVVIKIIILCRNYRVRTCDLLLVREALWTNWAKFLCECFATMPELDSNQFGWGHDPRCTLRLLPFTLWIVLVSNQSQNDCKSHSPTKDITTQSPDFLLLPCGSTIIADGSFFIPATLSALCWVWSNNLCLMRALLHRLS